MWTQEATQTYTARIKWLAKKREREYRGVLKNLNTYFTALCAGANPLQIKFGFIHPERRGVVALDQGGGRGMAETRLYVFPDDRDKVLWLLTVGDKKSQPDDIKLCHGMVADLLSEETSDASEGGATEAGEAGALREHRGDGP